MKIYLYQTRWVTNRAGRAFFAVVFEGFFAWMGTCNFAQAKKVLAVDTAGCFRIQCGYFFDNRSGNIIFWLLTSIFYNFPQNIRSINEAKLSFLWLDLHSLSFKCKINFASVSPLNFERRRLA